jgi:hypothetical protein
MSLAGNLQELLQKSDTITGILKDQKDILDSRYKTSEASLIKVIERRKVTMAKLETTQQRIEELNPLLLDIENQIAASTDQKTRTDLESERSKLATEYNEQSGQGAGTAGRKPDAGALHLDVPDLRGFAQQPDRGAEHADQQADHRYRTAHRALQGAGGFAEDRGAAGRGAQDQHARQPGRYRGGRDHGRYRCGSAEAHIGDLLEMHEKNMLSTQDIQRRKQLADDAFARRFSEVLEKHNSANYVKS